MANPVTVLILKELRTERRNPELIYTMVLLAATVTLTFAFASREPSPRLAATSLWISLLLASVLAVNRIYQREHQTGAFDALLSGPTQPSTLYLAKTITLCIYLLGTGLLTSFLCALLFNAGFLARPLHMAAVLAAGIAGLAAVGSLLAALGGRRSGDLVLALALMPLTVPVIIAAARATEALILVPVSTAQAGFWLMFLAGFDLLFGILSLWSFGPLIRR